MCYFSSASLSCLSGIITITEVRDTVCCFLARRYNTLAMHSESPIICWYCIKQRNQSPSPWCYWTKSVPDSNPLLDFLQAFQPLPALGVWICSCLKAVWISCRVCVSAYVRVSVSAKGLCSAFIEQPRKHHLRDTLQKSLMEFHKGLRHWLQLTPFGYRG